MKKTGTLSLFLAIFCVAAWAQNGTIRGTVTDKATGELLMFTNVLIKGSNPPLGAQTDLDGQYEITVSPGTYDLEVSYIGYALNTITEVEVKENEVTVIDFFLESESQVLEEIVVQAARIDRTENALLAIQRKAVTIQDGISAQEISRYGSGNAAESMKRVTGASVVDGKYVVVRGLGDRYSAAQLNGLTLPSTDPYRNSSPLDLIPSNLMDNVIASKTFTPNQPGNFTGGNVNISTKSFPERFTLSFTLSSSYNDQTSLKDDFLNYNGGNTDWLGFDDGTRELPAILTDPKVVSELSQTAYIRARRNDELAQLIDETTKSLNNQMAPFDGSSAFNHGLAFSIGNQYKLFNNPLGILASVNYSRNYNHYNNGIFRNWDLTDPNAPELLQDRDLTDVRSTDNPQVGGLLGMTYKFAGSQKIGFNFLYNHDAEKEARTLAGPFPAILSSGFFETRSLSWREREMQNYQLFGEHVLGENGVRIDWGASHVKTSQDEPDLRFFANSFNINADGDSSFFILVSEFPLPFHFFRELEDTQWQGKLDFTIPFAQEKSTANKIEFGGFYQTKDRAFTEARFQYQDRAEGTVDYDGDPEVFFGEDNLGLVGFNETRNQNVIGLFVTEETLPVNIYSGTEEIIAGYGMVTYDWKKLKLIAGARVENTNISVASADTTQPVGEINQLDFLPSLNLIYRLNESMNLRGSYNKTLARPNMRELAPFTSFEFLGDFRYTGNPNLERTLVDNLDARWEWYPTSGELVSVSAYYKQFTNPIILSFVVQAANQDEIEYINVDQANVYGLEFEFRKNLGFLANFLQDFKLTTNLSLIRSEVDIPDDEQAIIDQFNPEKGTSRQFQGQSPFLLNAGLNYQNIDKGWDITASLNVFGDRLDAISFGGRPDVFEKARPQLDLVIQKSIGERYGLKLSALNLLDPNFRKVMEFKGQEFIITDFQRGRVFGFSLSYNIR